MSCLYLAGVPIYRLAKTIDDEGLWEGFVTAVAVQAILENSETALS